MHREIPSRFFCRVLHVALWTRGDWSWGAQPCPGSAFWGSVHRNSGPKHRGPLQLLPTPHRHPSSNMRLKRKVVRWCCSRKIPAPQPCQSASADHKLVSRKSSNTLLAVHKEVSSIYIYIVTTILCYIHLVPASPQ